MLRSNTSCIFAAVILLVLLLPPAGAVAGTVSADLAYKPPDIKTINDYHYVAIPGALNLAAPGAPALPSDAVWLLLPPGEKAVSVELKGEVWRALPGKYLPLPASEPKPISDVSPTEPTLPDPSIYEGPNIFPDSPISNLNTHLKRGYALASCLVLPIRWNPVDGSLEYLAEAELTIETAPGLREQTGFNRFFRVDPLTRETVAGRVKNRNMLDRYPRRDDYIPEAILIVTANALLNAAEEYANWYVNRGRTVYIVTTVELCDEYEGRDDQEKIRTGIAALYEQWNLSYVILMGDTQHVPYRGFYADPEIGDYEPCTNIPTDLYYAALDGNWNSDGDEYWGEPDESDLFAEVALGRLPGDTEEDIRRITTKIINYSDEPVIDDVQSALMVGEDLGWNVMGGDYMDELYYRCRTNGYITIGIPELFRRYNLYDRDRIWSATEDLAPLISQGYHLVNHLGHSNSTSNMRFQIGSLNENLISNNGVENGHNIGYTQGCLAGAFDVDDCISERHICGLRTGFVAYISNSRYGWGSRNNTNGSSQHFHRQFIDAIFGEGITRIGEAQQDSKEDLAAWDYGTMRWCYYCSNLFCDPAMDIWTSTPEELEPEYSNFIIRGNDQFDVTVPGVRGALVSLIHAIDPPEILSADLTGGDGSVRLQLEEPVLDFIPLELSITAHNYIPFRSNIAIFRANGPYPWVMRMLIDDSVGNDNDIIDAGEIIIVNPSIRNIGRESLVDVNVTLDIEDEMVNLFNETNRYPHIGINDEVISEEGFELAISPRCEDQHDVGVRIEIENGSGDVWSQNLSFRVHAPQIGEWSVDILDDNENNNGQIDPGEEVDMRLSLANVGTGDAENVIVRLICDNDLVELVDAEAGLPILAASDSAVFQETLRIRVSDDFPNPSRVVLYFQLNSELGFYHTMLKDFDIGGMLYSFDNGEEKWEHYNIGGDDWGDQWCISTTYNHTPNGSACLKLGPQDTDDLYGNNLHCAVEIPQFQIVSLTEMTFWHMMFAEAYLEQGNLALDGGFVEISLDGQDWELLLPELSDGRGYPYVINEGPRESPINEMPCYSGEQYWCQALFDLTEFVGENVSIRFRFGSDRTAGKKGWMIDDIRFRLPRCIEPPLDLDGEIAGHGAHLQWNTPLPRRDDMYPNELLGYRLFRGNRLLDTLITDIEYFDDLSGMPSGDYYYMVSAEYTNGVSYPSNEIELYWNVTVVDQQDNPLPLDWALSEIFPNPFNSLVKISYSVPRKGYISLRVFDLNGRPVCRLTEGSRQSGRYVVTFDAGDLASGMYFVHMQTPDGFRAARLILIR